MRAFAVVFSRMRVRIRCPVLHVSLPEVYDKTAEIYGLTVLQLLIEDLRLGQTIQSSDGVLNCMSACKTFYTV